MGESVALIDKGYPIPVSLKWCINCPSERSLEGMRGVQKRQIDIVRRVYTVCRLQASISPHMKTSAVESQK